MQADDPDGEDVTYTLDDDADFTIDPDTGQITVAPDAQLEPGTYILTVTATTSEGSVATATVTITVTDVAEPSLQPPVWRLARRQPVVAVRLAARLAAGGRTCGRPSISPLWCRC